MKVEKRFCPYCGNQVDGRPNKVFCNSLCKGRHFREVGPTYLNEPYDPEPELTQRLVPEKEIPASSPQTKVHLEPEETYQQRTQRENQIREAEALHEKFCHVIREFLQYEGQVLSKRNVQRLRFSIEKLTHAYNQHPYLRSPESLSKARLTALYDIIDVVTEVSQEIDSKLLWQAEEGSYLIKDKWRKKLRELLVKD